MTTARMAASADWRKRCKSGPEQVLEQVKASGLRGRGGAGFPTGIKWQTVADADGEQKYIACNADEGDSGTFSDRILMESDPLTLIEGMIIAGFRRRRRTRATSTCARNTRSLAGF